MNRLSNRYDANDRDVDPQTGVLRNKLGITSQRKLDLLEGHHLLAAYEKAMMEYSESHRFSAEDIYRLHRMFLGEIYDWAGKYRSVDLGSGEIRWCHAKYILQEMTKYSEMLSSLTHFSTDLSREELLPRLARIHGELIVIHPFRDGNGRVTRFLCDLLLMQASRKPFGQSLFQRETICEEYFRAIKAVWSKADYNNLIDLFDRLLAQPCFESRRRERKKKNTKKNGK